MTKEYLWPVMALIVGGFVFHFAVQLFSNEIYDEVEQEAFVAKRIFPYLVLVSLAGVLFFFIKVSKAKKKAQQPVSISRQYWPFLLIVGSLVDDIAVNLFANEISNEVKQKSFIAMKFFPYLVLVAIVLGCLFFIKCIVQKKAQQYGSMPTHQDVELGLNPPLLGIEQAKFGPEWEGLPSFSVDLEKRVQDVHELLKGASVLGIFGMGGIGKTTLAKIVYNEVSIEFEYSCFVDNVKSRMINDLENWILTHFHRKGRRVEKTQWHSLKGKRTLIVMDDVDLENQLTKLPKLHHFKTGSRIIITGRNREVFEVYEDHKVYEVDLLDVQDAKKLFCHHAFGQDKILKDHTQRNYLNQNVMRVVDKCGGLPLTLEVVGRYLQGHNCNWEVWEETIEKLGNAQAINGSRNDRVWASLRVSYDALVKEEQEIFIEAATTFLGQPLEEALAAWSTSIGQSGTRWANLVSRSMVKEVWKKDSNVQVLVWVHEQLQDLAISLAKSNREEAHLVNLKDANMQVKEDTEDLWLETGSLLSVPSAKFQSELLGKQGDIRDSLVEEDTKVLRLSRPWSGVLHLDSLAKLRELKYLVLDGIEGGLDFRGSGKNFPRKLSLLKWSQHWYRRPKFPISLNGMTRLAVLALENWDTEEGFSDQFGDLNNLRILHLRNLKGLDSLPETISNLSRLKQLKLENLKLSRLPESFGSLFALEHLALSSVEYLKDLPESFGDLSSLETLRIEHCRKLGSLPASFGSNLTSLKVLIIRKCPMLEFLPQSFSQLFRLQRLSVSECEGLKELGESFGNLPVLRYLTLSSTSVERLPESFGRLTALEELKLEGAFQLKVLPDSISQLTALKVMRIHAPLLTTLPEGFGQLTALKDLSIKAIRLVTLPESIAHLTSLQDLVILCPKLTRLPESLGELARLETLKLGVHTVKELPVCFGKLSTTLKELEIHAESLGSFPPSIGELSSLRRLEIDCHNLEKLPDDLGELSALKELSISSGKLESLPESTARLQSLQTLVLWTESMRNLPESIRKLSSLQVVMFNCDGHERMPINFNHLPCSSLRLSGNKTQILPDGVGSHPSLENLDISHMQSLESLPDELGKLSSLRMLTIAGCKKLEILPDSLGCISSLGDVKIFMCKKLKSLPSSLGQPSSQVAPLQEERTELFNLVEEPSSQTRAKEGIRLHVEGCLYLEDDVLRSLGWVRKGDGEDSYHVRENVFPVLS